MNAILEQLEKEYRLLLGGIGFGSKPTNFIGLDIGHRYFRAVRIKKTGDLFLVQDALVDKIEELVNLPDKMRIKDDEEVCINLNMEGVIIKRISMPVMPHEEIENALRWELKEQAEFDIDKAKIKFNTIGEKQAESGSKRMELMVFAYQEASVESKVRQLKEFGLNVKHVIPMDFALAKYLNSSKIIEGRERKVIVDIGGMKTIISMVENGKVYFRREVLVGGDAITEAMMGVTMSEKGRIELSREDAENMKMEGGIPQDIKIFSRIRPVLEKLTTQIRASLEYCENQFSCVVFKKIILAGNGSKLKGLAEYLHREAGVEVETILEENSGAIGLALSSGAGLNMLPEKFRREDKKALKRFSITMFVTMLGLILFLSYAFLFIQAINLKKEVRIQSQYRDNLKDIKLLRDKIMAYNLVIQAASSNGADCVKTMKELSNMIIPGAVFESLAINSAEPNVVIGGAVLKQNLLTEFMSNLESNPVFHNVKLSFSEQNPAYGIEAVKFEITSNIRKK